MSFTTIESKGPSLLLPERVTDAISSVTGKGPVKLHEPSFIGNEWTYLKECLDSSFVSSVGKYVDQFEDDLAKYTGSKYVIVVVNGTAALHMALKLAGVQQNDEVLIPSLTFVATTNAVHYCGAIPHFVDSEEKTLGMAAEPLRTYLNQVSEQHHGKCINISTNRVIRAIVPMHTFGHPCDLENLIALARDFNLELIEDAAESLGSFYDGKHTGTFGLMGILSFNGNKIITTGGGGAILTNDKKLALRAKHLTTTAKLPHRWGYEHDEVGYNYRLPNLNAAIGCAQLEHLPNFLLNKRKLFENYEYAFADLPEVKLVKEPDVASSNYWLQTLLLKESIACQRDKILEFANDAGLMCRSVWKMMHLLKPYQNCPRAPLPVAESLASRIINIPSSPSLDKK